MTSIGTLAKVDSSELNKSTASAATSIRTPDSVDRTGPTTSPTAQISSAGKLQHALSELTDSLHKLSKPDTWRATKATSSSPEVVEASAPVAGQAIELNLQVDQVAAAQSTSMQLSAPLSTAVGLGVLSIEVGKWNDNFQAFTPNPNWPKAAISTGPGDTSINKLKDKINAAGLGVVANVISAPTGNYLVLAASATGQNNGFRVTAEPDPSLPATQAQGLKRLEFDPPNNPNGMNLRQPAQDAAFKVNGESRTSESNFVSGVVPGVDITLKQGKQEKVLIRVEPDRDHVSDALKSFTQSFNRLQDTLSTAETKDGKGYALAQEAAQSVSAIWEDDSPHSAARAELERLGLSMQSNGQMAWSPARFESTEDTNAKPSIVNTLLRQLPQDNADTSADNSSKPAPSDNTSALFRQAVIGQYTNNMYLEDVN